MSVCVLARRSSALVLVAAVLAGGAGPAAQAQGQAAAPPDARPQMTDTDADRHRVHDYLAQGPSPWQPPALASLARAPADLVVAADGSGHHRSLQAALDALPAAGSSSRRHVVRLKPGLYRETLCVRDKAPFALVGDPADASAVRLVDGRYNAQTTGPGGAVVNPCVAAPGGAAAGTVGTAGSATLAVFSDDVQLAHLTVVNDALDTVRDGQGYPPGAGESGGAQAVALMTQGDRLHLHDVRLVGHQDTLYVRAAPGAAAARVLVEHSLVAGDVDFIFGDATLVVRHSTVLSRGGRRTPGERSHVLAPSTPQHQRLGFLVTDSRWLAEPGLAPASVSIGRAWDAGVPRGQWQAGVSPNGQALVRNSHVGGHITGWAASTSRRPFGSGNRLSEHRNTLVDHGVEREVLPVDGGWAAAAGGTWGGVDARPADVFTVHSRAQLLAALSGPPRPRIVRVAARIDLAADDTGRSLGADDFRDPVFDLTAFVQAYDPATWGRADPTGPLEEARRRSARRQAAHVQLRVPSNTTVVGVVPGAGFVNGGLLLDQVDNVIVRQLHLSDAYDHFPAWEPRDNGHGEWNAAYDNLGLRQATHVWVDHNTLDDGDRPDHREPLALGRPLMRHDGLLDITHRADFVTVSWNHFRQHDKTTLVGGSDNHRDDAGRLRVSFFYNRWQAVKERAPRVRFGRVHLLNNLHEPDADGPYAWGYSIGVGLDAQLLSQGNQWLLPPGLPASRVVRVLKGRHLVDQGSRVNEQPADLAEQLRVPPPGPGGPQAPGADVAPAHRPSWQPLTAPPPWPTTVVADRVRAGAGAPGAVGVVGDGGAAAPRVQTAPLQPHGPRPAPANR